MEKPDYQNLNTAFSEHEQPNIEFMDRPECQWHSHVGIQILIATDGMGYYQEKGAPVRLLANGEVVFIPPGVEHWHAAAASSAFTDVIIPGKQRNELVSWLQKHMVY